MHCYAHNFEEVEGANWFGPVRLSIHLPLPPPTPKKKGSFFFLDFDSLWKEFVGW